MATKMDQHCRRLVNLTAVEHPTASQNDSHTFAHFNLGLQNPPQTLTDTQQSHRHRLALVSRANSNFSFNVAVSPSNASAVLLQLRVTFKNKPLDVLLFHAAMSVSG